MTYLFIIPLTFILIVVLLYNNLISKKNKLEEAYSSIDVMLKKRTDLIPQLVNTIKGYTKHESETLIAITKLRNKIVEKSPPSDLRLNLETQIDRLLGELQISVEAYPDLKASENFLLLQTSLNEVEEQLSAARRTYNAAVNSFNNGLDMFPSNLMAKLMGYSRKELFEIDPVESESPKISF